MLYVIAIVQVIVKLFRELVSTVNILMYTNFKENNLTSYRLKRFYMF